MSELREPGSGLGKGLTSFVPVSVCCYCGALGLPWRLPFSWGFFCCPCNCRTSCKWATACNLSWPRLQNISTSTKITIYLNYVWSKGTSEGEVWRRGRGRIACYIPNSPWFELAWLSLEDCTPLGSGGVGTAWTPLGLWLLWGGWGTPAPASRPHTEQLCSASSLCAGRTVRAHPRRFPSLAERLQLSWLRRGNGGGRQRHGKTGSV